MQRGSSLKQESVEDEDANPPAFLALRPALLAADQHAYWTEDTWGIGPGHPHDTIEVLDRMGDLSIHIKKMYLSFSVNNVWKGSPLLQDTIKSIQADNDNLEIANLRGLERFASRCDSISTELAGTWRWKFSVVCWLDLTELSLDLRDPYGPNDV